MLNLSLTQSEKLARNQTQIWKKKKKKNSSSFPFYSLKSRPLSCFIQTGFNILSKSHSDGGRIIIFFISIIISSSSNPSTSLWKFNHNSQHWWRRYQRDHSFHHPFFPWIPTSGANPLFFIILCLLINNRVQASGQLLRVSAKK